MSVCLAVCLSVWDSSVWDSPPEFGSAAREFREDHSGRLAGDETLRREVLESCGQSCEASERRVALGAGGGACGGELWCSVPKGELPSEQETVGWGRLRIESLARSQ